jgi:hypothetical protein
MDFFSNLSSRPKRRDLQFGRFDLTGNMLGTSDSGDEWVLGPEYGRHLVALFLSQRKLERVVNAGISDGSSAPTLEKQTRGSSAQLRPRNFAPHPALDEANMGGYDSRRETAYRNGVEAPAFIGVPGTRVVRVLGPVNERTDKRGFCPGNSPKRDPISMH